MRDEFAAAGKGEQFDLLKSFLANETDTGGYDAVAAKLEMRAQTVAVTVHRMRERYRELVRIEVAETVSGVKDIQAELLALFG